LGKGDGEVKRKEKKNHGIAEPPQAKLRKRQQDQVGLFAPGLHLAEGLEDELAVVLLWIAHVVVDAWRNSDTHGRAHDTRLGAQV
jgi:hypothetical protein